MANARYETRLFQEQMVEIRRSDKHAAEQIDAIVARIVSNPEINDGQLKGDRAGQFKKKAVGKKYRIIFKSCAYCMKTRREKCAGCEEREETAVTLQEVFPRSEGYD